MGFCTKNTIFVVCFAYLAWELIEICGHPKFPKLVSHLSGGLITLTQEQTEHGQAEAVCNPLSDLDTAICPEIHAGTILKATCLQSSTVHSGHIVLIVSYSHTGGVLGLVLNGPHIPVGSTSQVLYGGPQGTFKRHQLHSDASLVHSRKVVDGLYFGGDMRITPAGDVAVFYGSTYWAAGTLEQESEAGLWEVLGEATASSVLEHSKST